MSQVPVSAYISIAKKWDDNRRVIEGPDYADRPHLGFVHKFAGNKRFDDGYNDVRVYAAIRIFYDSAQKSYYILTADEERIYGNFFDPDVALEIGGVIASQDE